MRALNAALLAALCASIPHAQAECTLDVGSRIEFGTLPVETAPLETEQVIAVTVTCPVGTAWSLAPRQTATALPLDVLGKNNGSAYLMLRRLDRTLMESGNSSTHITGTGTGLPEDVSLRVFLSGSNSSPSTPVSAIGEISRSASLLRLSSGGTDLDSPAQTITGSITGVCSITSSGHLDFGTVPAPSAPITHDRTTTLSVQCTDLVAYRLYGDHPTGSTNTWTANTIRPVPGQESQIALRTQLRAGAGEYADVSTTLYHEAIGAGTRQDYDFRARLELQPGAVGTFEVIVRPTVVF